MDTAQRGGGLTWKSAQELIRRAQAEARAEGGTIAFGAGTDHLAPTPAVTLDDVRRAYEEQVGYVEGVGRPRDPHGEPRAREGGALAPTTTARFTAACCGR